MLQRFAFIEVFLYPLKVTVDVARHMGVRSVVVGRILTGFPNHHVPLFYDEIMERQQLKIALTKTALVLEYRKLVGRRIGKQMWMGKVDDKITNRVACELKSVKLAGLFVRAQFARMPLNWCKEKFRRPYPPFTVVFGGNCMQRYAEYLERGIDDGC